MGETKFTAGQSQQKGLRPCPAGVRCRLGHDKVHDDNAEDIDEDDDEQSSRLGKPSNLSQMRKEPTPGLLLLVEERPPSPALSPGVRLFHRTPIAMHWSTFLTLSREHIHQTC